MAEVEPLFKRPVNVTGFNDFFFDYANKTLFSGLWGEMILMMVFCISMLSMMQFGVRRPFVASSFLTWVSSVLLLILGVVGSLELTITTTLVVISLMVVGGEDTLV